MEFAIKSGHPEKQRTACVVAGVYEPRRLTPVVEVLDKESESYISNIIRRGDMEGKLGQILLLHNVPNLHCDRVLLVGCGKERELSNQQFNNIIAKAINTLNETGSMEAVCYLTELNVRGHDVAWNVKQAVLSTFQGLYRFDQLKSKKDTTRRPLRKLVLNVPKRRDLPDGEQALQEAMAIGNGLNMAKDLGNLPGNICTPRHLSHTAKELAGEFDKLSIEILGEDQMQELNMGSFLSVSKGSREEGQLIILHYKNDNKTAPVVLVGKGITFDSGGISIKPAAEMDQMKFDMCGAASVLGTLRAIAELNLPINVIGVIAAAENLPDGQANKPGDIVTSMSGQTIEVLNTDAEGRLVLCDALTYVERFEPAAVIDIATLTGACVVALGSHASGVLSNHNPLAHDLINAGKAIGDQAWQLPLWDEYQEQLNSNFADMANVGGKEAGAITAGCFLSRFTKKFHWAHIDIAGTAWNTGAQKGATGRPVPLLSQFLIDYCHKD